MTTPASKGLAAALDAATCSSFPRRALVCLVGLSPQVVTETLYALIRQESPAFVPTELHIISTARGAAAVREQLMAEGGGPFYQLQRELLGSVQITFDPECHLHIIQRDGHELDDIESVEDNTALADTVLEVLRPLARDSRCAIHASIAGGRKSMGFYLGYVLSLLGRPQDRLSHVLVNAPFESQRGFFYPSTPAQDLTLADGRVVSSAAAHVVLAPIGFVRLADGLRAQIETQGLGFNDLIQRAQATLMALQVEVAPAARQVRLSRVGSVSLEPAMMAWYCFFALRRQRGLRESEQLVAPGMVQVHKDAARSIGFDQALLDLACRRVGIEPLSVLQDPSELRYRVSTINGVLKRAFGTELGQRLSINGPKDRGTRDGQYGLSALDAQSIVIV